MTKRWTTAATTAALMALAACSSDATGGGSGGRRVDVRMSVPMGGVAARTTEAQAAGQMTISGANGEITLTALRLVVAEFELDGDDDLNPCAGDDCEDFDAGPAFVDVPLTGGTVTVASGDLPDGAYEALEFEVEDLDDDGENPAERARIDSLRQVILAEVPDWPRKASILATGTFRPRVDGVLGDPRPFRVFFEAEIEIETDLAPPLVVSASSASRGVSLTLDPGAWFSTAGGNVMDLGALNGRTVAWDDDIRIRNGFRDDDRG